ncbi:PTS sugar transporter subunit IIA [Spectribacter hydrogenooxidans]|uniref:PTS sugar transporter subunit IIA n=1 Tax=Spectribacter hydrogenoxidans TaxID=3075608 RepID=A0ABU3BX12_9GAMM|nr:PTS sugar transporter subunit IIA [Salinisphaera sp. W335]MDT0633841.1 PTS sugar transporter subunit IIA [Salinisphaera sp. W335]
MNLADIIAAERIRVIDDAQSKKRSLERLSEILAEGTPYLSATEIFTALVAREKLGSTALGDGVAIPHGRLKGLDECVGAMIRLPEGVDFEAPDGKPVDILFGLLVPQDSTDVHLNILRGLAELFTEEDTLRAMRAADNDKVLHEILIERDPMAQAG